MEQSLRVYPDIETLSREAAAFIYSEACRLAESGGSADIILSGGSTPALCYGFLSGLLDSDYRDFSRINWLLGDERWVPASDKESNERMIRETLFASNTKNTGTLYSWKACIKSRYMAADEYGNTVDYLLHDGKKAPDILILGLGSDGHTASLFPDSLVMHENGELIRLESGVKRSAVAVYVPGKGFWRLSLTPRVLSASRLVIFLVSGKEKKEALSGLLAGVDPDVPATWVKGEKKIFFVTRDAAF